MKFSLSKKAGVKVDVSDKPYRQKSSLSMSLFIEVGARVFKPLWRTHRGFHVRDPQLLSQLAHMASYE